METDLLKEWFQWKQEPDFCLFQKKDPDFCLSKKNEKDPNSKSSIKSKIFLFM